jgi:Flp pilus assembly protein TadG
MTHHRRRQAAVTLEFAIVYPVLFLLLLFLVVGGIGVFQYQQVASLTSAAVRWASTHGGQYAQDQGVSVTTPEDVYQAIAPMATGFGPKDLKLSVSWDDAGEMPSYYAANGQIMTNRVHVTLTYRWKAEGFISGCTMTCTSEAPVSY